VKKDQRRFPRSVDASGRSVEILSPFSRENRDADGRAFAALMRHLRTIDGERHTIVMVQVENEIGMIPSARDHSEQAGRLFASAVPGELMAYLVGHAETLAPELSASFERDSPPSLADGAIAGERAAAGGSAWPAGGLVIATAADEFLFAGIGVTVTFASQYAWKLWGRS
jgi:hypothetical protein